MIKRSDDFDLGLDRKRMKDKCDRLRQTATVDVLLTRFFAAEPKRRCEIQILADEVGMGKTFVALAVAYSILQHLKRTRIEPDMEGCYQRVLVITPNNEALFRKWQREVSEFVGRCVKPQLRDDAAQFASVAVTRLDDLAAELRRPGRQRQVIITRMGIFGGDRLTHYDLKRQFLLGCLFHHWGNRFNIEQRERLLRGAPYGWPKKPSHLTELDERDDQKLPFNEDELLRMLENMDAATRDDVEALLEKCRVLATPFTRRGEAFWEIERHLVRIYRAAALQSFGKAFPLLVVDEAHNWKNGPLYGTNGFFDFRDHIAPRVRRALLLTATPFQLRPDEMLEIMKVSDFIRPRATLEASRPRVEALRRLREEVIRPALENSERHSRRFSKAWSRLPRHVTTEELDALWLRPALIKARDKLSRLLEREVVVTDFEGQMREIIDGALAGMDPDVREFLREALLLYACNHDLSRKLGRIVIRHRRRPDHRLFRIGAEYVADEAECARRPDSHLLHGNVGLDIRGEGELPQFLLMRCVSAMKGGHGKSSLGSNLTGCYSTLRHSAEGHEIQERLKHTDGKLYLDLLLELVNERADPKHPKFAAVVEKAVELWERGEKLLIFCFRVNTAERLHHVLRERIRKQLNARRRSCLGGEEKLKSLRSRLTARDRDLVSIGLDRLLWSAAWVFGKRAPFRPEEFLLEDSELNELARLALKHGVDLTKERLDRVFLNRVTEHLLARRFISRRCADGRLRQLVRHISDETWIAEPYGLTLSHEQHEDEGEETASFDERGCHHIYRPEQASSAEKVEALATRLIATRRAARSRRQQPVLDVYALAPSLWLGAAPREAWQQRATGSTSALAEIHENLWKLTFAQAVDRSAIAREADNFDFTSRALVLQALRRALFRDSVLVRLLPSRAEREEGGWGELLAEAFYTPLPSQHESMAHRIAVFLEDLESSSGHVADPATSRGAFHAATRLAGQQFVALVKGGQAMKTRDRVLTGFNTPLLPEILICTQVGQEGIDLHRHCSHVVHYDLAWNPAVLEQRTGRADRIGSKTFRERDATGAAATVFLDIGVPFLAGTYDERMYEELLLRAQTFEVLTGGDFAADHSDGFDDAPGAQGKPLGVSLTPLPSSIIKQLKVNLSVWRKQDGGFPTP